MTSPVFLFTLASGLYSPASLMTLPFPPLSFTFELAESGPKSISFAPRPTRSFLLSPFAAGAFLLAAIDSSVCPGFRYPRINAAPNPSIGVAS